MAIQTVRANINGTWHTLTYNSGSAKWTATLTAPGATSYNLQGGFYSIQVEATNTAGTMATADASTLDGLKLVVRETIAPVVTILSPTGGAYVSNNRQPVVFTAVDEAGGSGIDLAAVSVKVDGVAASGGITSTAITGGYTITYAPPSALSDGAHTVTVAIKDHDGNAAVEKSTTYTIDTVPPTLNVTSPAEGLITAVSTVTVAGVTNDTTSSPVTVVVTLNGAEQGGVTVNADGSFGKAVTLADGRNTIVVKSTDAAGKYTSVTRNVTLDASVPKITQVKIAPNPVDAGASMVVEVTVQ